MTWSEAIKGHYASVWKVTGASCDLPSGPTSQLPPGFGVLRFAPHGTRALWTYATRCMSRPTDACPIELHMFSPYASDAIVELLVATAHYHATGSALNLGHVVNFGRPWLAKSLCDRALISLPYLDGPAIEHLSDGARDIRFYWLLPITTGEARYIQDHGVEALEERFERGGFDYADPERRSVV